MAANRVAVLLATYNGQAYLDEFLESLVSQSFQGFDLIVRDDCSSDETLKILERHSRRLPIRFLDGSERLGAAKSFLRLLVDASDGYDAYLFADQDDRWNPEKTGRALERLDAHGPAPALYCAGLELVDSRLEHIAFSRPPRVLGLENALVENVAVGCTSALNAAGRRLVIDRLPERLVMHDWWMYMVLAALGTVVYDDYPSLKYRQHGGNAIGAATSIYRDYARRLGRFFSNDQGGVFGVAAQAEEFRRCLGPRLPARQASLVDRLVTGKKSLAGRVGLALSSDFVRQRLVDTVILRILFLLARF